MYANFVRRRIVGQPAAVIVIAVLAALSQMAGAQTASIAAAPVTAEVRQIHAKTLVIDPHIDIPFDFGAGVRDPRLDGDMRFDFPKARRGGIGAVAIALYVPQGPLSPEGYANAQGKLDLKLRALKTSVASNRDQMEIALTPDDVLRIRQSGKVAVIMSFLNAYSLGEDLAQIDRLHGEGVRMAGFVHAGNNAFADSSRPSGLPAESWGGLSALGRAAVKRMNELGMLIDISQLSRAAALQTMAASRAPVIASHSGVRSMINHPRNLDDAELKALVSKGGVIAINAYKPYLKAIPAAQLGAVLSIRAAYGLPLSYTYEQEGANRLRSDLASKFSHEIEALVPEATVSDLVDAIDGAVARLGVDHVAISSDFNHGGGVLGWSNEGEAINVTAELVKRGYTITDIEKIWGGNVLRVWRAAQRDANGK